MSRKKSRSIFIAMCATPALLLYIIFMIIPTFNVFKMSLYKWGGYSENKKFVGINNFIILLRDPNFYRAFQNTVIILVFVTIFTLAMALGLAAILMRKDLKGKSFFRVIFYIPNILSIVVISAIFSAVYDQKDGLLNSFLKIFMGQDTSVADLPQYLGNQRIIVYSIIVAMIWQAFGYYMVMYMAGISAIPESIYESASIEGMGKFRQFFSITIPLIWTNIRTTLTFFIISTINISFLIVTALTGGGPDGASEVVLSYMYKQAYTNSTYGYGMAVGAVVFIFSFALSAIVNHATKREIVEF